MAEARAAVDNIRVVGALQLEAVAHRAKLRGPQAHAFEGGLVVVVPSPSILLRLALYKSYHVYYHFQVSSMCLYQCEWKLPAGLALPFHPPLFARCALIQYTVNSSIIFVIFQRACWPAPVWAVIAILTAFFVHVIISGNNSWFRSGPVATMLWEADSCFLGNITSFAHVFVILKIIDDRIHVYILCIYYN